MSHPSRRPTTRKKGPFAFGPVNYALLAVGVIVVIWGYLLLDRGSITAAPLLLVIGYAVLLPTGILAGWRRIGSDDE